MGSDTSSTSMLLSLGRELKKEFIELDGQDRPIKYFQAPLHVGDTEPCLVTEVAYKDLTSTVIIKSKEYIGEWDSTYEL